MEPDERSPGDIKFHVLLQETNEQQSTQIRGNQEEPIHYMSSLLSNLSVHHSKPDTAYDFTLLEQAMQIHSRDERLLRALQHEHYFNVMVVVNNIIETIFYYTCRSRDNCLNTYLLT